MKPWLTSSFYHDSQNNIVWLSSEQVLFYRLDRPKVPKRKWPNIVPWMVEEMSLAAPSLQHMVLIDDKANNYLMVMAIPKAQMDAWQKKVAAQDIRCHYWLCNIFALPSPTRARQWVIYGNEYDCVVRSGAHQGFGIKTPLLANLLAELDSQETSECPEQLVLYGRGLDSVLKIKQWNNISVKQCSDSALKTPSVPQIKPYNLLQGEYKKRLDWKHLLSTKQVIPTLLKVGLVLVWVILMQNIYHVHQQHDFSNQQMVRQLERFFGRKPEHVAFNIWLDDIEHRLQQAHITRRKKLWPQLAFVDSLLSSCSFKCQVMDLMASQDGLTVTVTGDNTALEKLKTQLFKSDIQGLSINFSPEGASDTFKVIVRYL